MHWLQEYGNTLTKKGQRVFHCKSTSDLSGLPTESAKGTGGIDGSSNEICAIGSQCVVVTAGEVYELVPDEGWIKFGG